MFSFHRWENSQLERGLSTANWNRSPGFMTPKFRNLFRKSLKTGKSKDSKKELSGYLASGGIMWSHTYLACRLWSIYCGFWWRCKTSSRLPEFYHIKRAHFLLLPAILKTAYWVVDTSSFPESGECFKSKGCPYRHTAILHSSPSSSVSQETDLHRLYPPAHSWVWPMGRLRRRPEGRWLVIPVPSLPYYGFGSSCITLPMAMAPSQPHRSHQGPGTLFLLLPFPSSEVLHHSLSVSFTLSPLQIAPLLNSLH